MSREFFASIALPRNGSGDAKVHVSVYLAPKILPDQDGEALGLSELFPSFTKAVVDDLRVTIRDQDGPMDARLVSVPDPDLWARLFPEDLPVRGNPVPYLDDHTWRSFSARSVHDMAKGMHLQSVYADATTPPAPSAHPMTAELAQFTRRTTRAFSPGNGYEEYARRSEDVASTWLDELVDRARNHPRPEGALELPRRDPDHPKVEPNNVEFGEAYLNRIFLELHRARRFYERPESAEAFAERPTQKSERLKSREGEFHERVAMTGDSGLLMRRLGLVLDLQVDDPERLTRATRLWASVAIQGRTDWNRPYPLLVQPAAGSTVIPTPRGPDWRSGMAALGNEQLFTVLDLDPDGSALKSERHLWSVPRMAQIEANGDAVTAATPALRSVGFTVSRDGDGDATQDQAYRQKVLDNRLAAAADGVDEESFASQPPLFTEDVTRGMRVEVWDDHSLRWHSLHRRISRIEVGGVAVTDENGAEKLENEGFLQASNVTQTPGVDKAPVHAHEALFGWDGWSLAVPRPGKRVRNVTTDEPTVNGLPRVDEVTEDPDTGLVDGEAVTHPIKFTHDLAPGTLPVLRFGHNYSFRAWAVDLAGDDARGVASGPGQAPFRGPDAGGLGGGRDGDGRDGGGRDGGGRDGGGRDGGVDPGALEELLTDGHVREAIDQRSRDRLGDLAEVMDGLRAAGVKLTERRGADQGDQPIPFTEFEGRNDARTAVLDALRRLHGGHLDLTVPTSGLTRARHVSGLVADFGADDSNPYLAQTRTTEIGLLARLLAASVDPVAFENDKFAAVMDVLATVTLPMPFLRWDPVPSPAVVARAVFTEGESLRVLVVRSQVRQAADLSVQIDAEPTVSQRHLAPAKTSQVQAEQHGAFDATVMDGTGAPTASGIRKALAQSLRENGSFHRLEIADLSAPGTMVPTYGDTATTAQVMRVVSAPVPQRREPVELDALKVGDPLPPGYYVVHDTDGLVLPYLPDPLAHGLAVTFPEAGADRWLAFPFGVEGFTAPFAGNWPELQPFRLDLEAGDALSASVEGSVATFRLPPGDVQSFTLSSSLDADNLDLFGLWRTLPEAARANADVREAAADGLLWGLTPGERFLLVHALPRPVLVPEPTPLVADRAWASRSATVHGAVRLHGSSTDRLTAHATWTDPVDDLAKSAPETVTTRAIAFTTPVLAWEEVSALGNPGSQDRDVHVPGHGKLRIHLASHEFADTKHHLVDYRMRAFTRFREYFDPALLVPDPNGPRDEDGTLLDDGQSLLGPVVQVDVPSSARPSAPVVHSVLPLFRWSSSTEPEQPMAWRHRRQSGLRIYLERPWYSSGDGELLGVLLAPDGVEAARGQAPDGSGHPLYSQWGGDPIWLGNTVDRRALSLMELDALLPVGGPERVLPARPVTGPRRLPVSTPQGDLQVDVLGYRPQFNEERGLWFVDVALDGAAFWPFVRLSVARYQPSSIDGAHLSEPVRCDFAQLPPERTVSVNRTDEHSVRVVVVGPMGLRDRPARVRLDGVEQLRRNRLVVARLQSPDPEIPGDLGWKTEGVTELMPRGVGDVVGEVAWEGELHASGDDAQLLSSSTWRVTVEEWERFPGDPDESGEPVWEQRLVFADEFAL